MAAVLTCDIVNSTLLDPDQEQLLLTELKQILSGWKHEFYRGDSFQVYLESEAQALQVALLCRTAAISMAREETEIIPDVRVSIGIGDVEKPVTDLGSAKGEAFLLSGRALDDMDKEKGRLVISIRDTLAQAGLSLVADYINSICKQMTPKQAVVIYALLRGETQQEVADKLKKSKSTISQHVTAGRWEEIETILKKYSAIIELASL